MTDLEQVIVIVVCCAAVLGVFFWAAFWPRTKG